jgi:hypothetical protein
MGHWGTGPFDSDQALDAAAMMVTRRGVWRALSGSSDEALAAGEVIAAACGAIDEPGLYQSEGTGLVAAMTHGSDKEQAWGEIKQQMGGKHFLPPELAEAIRAGKLTFDARDCAQALMMLEERCLDPQELSGWSDPEERETAVREVLARIDRYTPEGDDAFASEDVPDDECL